MELVGAILTPDPDQNQPLTATGCKSSRSQPLKLQRRPDVQMYARSSEIRDNVIHKCYYYFFKGNTTRKKKNQWHFFFSREITEYDVLEGDEGHAMQYYLFKSMILANEIK